VQSAWPMFKAVKLKVELSLLLRSQRVLSCSEHVGKHILRTKQPFQAELLGPLMDAVRPGSTVIDAGAWRALKKHVYIVSCACLCSCFRDGCCEVRKHNHLHRYAACFELAGPAISRIQTRGKHVLACCQTRQHSHHASDAGMVQAPQECSVQQVLPVLYNICH
jgi:hypothetical protein